MREFQGMFASDSTTGALAFTTEVASLDELPRKSEIIDANGSLFTVTEVLPGPKDLEDPNVKISVCLHVREAPNETVEGAEKFNEAIYSQFKTEFSTTIACPGGGQYYVLPYKKAKDLKTTSKIIINGNHREVFWVGPGVGPDGEPVICVKVKGSYIDAPFDARYDHFIFLVRDKDGKQYQIGSFDEGVSSQENFHVTERRKKSA